MRTIWTVTRILMKSKSPSLDLPGWGLVKILIEPCLKLADTISTQLRYLFDSLFPHDPPTEPYKSVLVTYILPTRRKQAPAVLAFVSLMTALFAPLNRI